MLVVFGPFDDSPGGRQGEYRLRGRRESVAAPARSITLRGHRVRADGTLDPAEVPLDQGLRITIVCGCGHRNELDVDVLSAMAEGARAAIGDHGAA
jgi:hypothetical protein